MLGVDEDEITNTIKIHNKKEFGDLSIAIFKLNKYKDISTIKIQELINEKLNTEVVRCELHKEVYLNFFINKNIVVEAVINNILQENKIIESNNKNVFIEVDEVKVANEITERNIVIAVLGNVLKNIFRTKGYNAILVNNLNDDNSNKKRVKEVKGIYKNFNLKFSHIKIKSGYRNFEKEKYDKLLINKINGVDVITLENYNMAPYEIKNNRNELEINTFAHRIGNSNYNRIIYIVAKKDISIVKRKIKVLELLKEEKCEIVQCDMIKFEKENIFRVLDEDIGLNKLMKLEAFKKSKFINNRERLVDSIKYTLLNKSNKKNSYIEEADIFEEKNGCLGYIIKTKVRINNILRAATNYNKENISRLVDDNNKYELIMELSNYSKVLELIIVSLEIEYLNKYIINIIDKFNEVYINNDIKSEDIVLIKAIDVIMIDILEIMGLRVSLWG